MIKKILLPVLSLCCAGTIFAGGILTNTNQSIHFLRNPARGASIEIDAAYTNPAGLVKLPFEGFHFGFTNQSVSQTRTISTEFAPFVGFGGLASKEFKGEATAPIVPSIQAAYKKGSWVLSGNIAISGGGGKATFNRGLPSFEAPISMLPMGINNLGLKLGQMNPGSTLTADKYSVDSYMEGSSMIYGAQMGGSYAINSMFSVYGGFRMNIVNNGYEGHIRNIKTNPTSNIPGFGNGSMVSASDYFAQLAQMPGLPQEDKDALLLQSASTKDKYLDSKQSGWGVTPIVGFNFNWEKLNVGIKYEFRSSLDIANKTKVDDTGSFKDGVNTPHDIPALFTIGAQYDIIKNVRLSAGYHRFFDSNANMDKDKQKHINGGTNEYLAGIEWQINDMFLISGGGQITRQGVKDAYQADLSYALDSYSLGFGGAVNVSPRVRINLAYFFTNYDNWTKVTAKYAETPLQGTEIFSRTNKIFGAGVDFRF
ncbi:membrane protein [Bacteroidales bacterium]|nr:membrane protein [Bacteroidales bacterium]